MCCAWCTKKNKCACSVKCVWGLLPFDTMDEPNTLWLKLKKWIRSFNLYLEAKGVDSDGQKVALLLYMGGMEV